MKTHAIVEYIVNWLVTYARDAGLGGYVVGVSGGIDSAVTSALCARTGMTVLALNMPIYQARDQHSRAGAHIRHLESRYPNVAGHHLDLGPVLDSMKQCLPPGVQDDLTMANTRSRLRMVALYSFASHYKLLVAGTGNKVEDFGVGFFTKYGDGGVDVSPIADLMKSQVYEIGRELEVMDDILAAPPTDGLFEDNRTDEGQIGASYPELEWAMGITGDPEGLPPRQQEVIRIYRRFHSANRHKMIPVPVCEIPPALKE